MKNKKYDLNYIIEFIGYSSIVIFLSFLLPDDSMVTKKQKIKIALTWIILIVIIILLVL